MDDQASSKMVPRSLPAGLTLSVLGLLGILSWEGYSSIAYQDSAGVQTIGFGSTRLDGRPVKPGDTIDPVRALIAVRDDLTAKEREMRACLGPVPLAQHEWDAYVSLAYNIGTQRWCRSTLVRKLKQTPPDYAGACAEILRWNRANGQVVRGLVRRREQEFRTCMGQ
jgi:lysozyme